MTSRIHDNQIKALIYILIFAAMILKAIFLQPSLDKTESRTAKPEITLPVTNDPMKKVIDDCIPCP